MAGKTQLDISSRLPQTSSHFKSEWKPASDTNWLSDALAARLPPTPAATASTRCEWRPSSDTSWLNKRKPQAEEPPSVGADDFPGAADLEESLKEQAAIEADPDCCGEATSRSTSWASDSEEESDAAAAAGPFKEASWPSWASETDDVETDDLEPENDGATSGVEVPTGLPLTQLEPQCFQDFQQESSSQGLGFFASSPYAELGYVQCASEEPMNVSMFGDVCSYMVPMGPVALADFHELPRRTPLRTAPAFMPSSFMAPAAPPQQGRMSAKSVKSRPSCKSTRRVVAQIPGEASPWWSTMSHQRGPADAPRVKVGQCVLVSA